MSNTKLSHKDKNIGLEESEQLHDTSLGDLEPHAEIKGGSIYKVTDVTLKRGVIE